VARNAIFGFIHRTSLEPSPCSPHFALPSGGSSKRRPHTYTREGAIMLMAGDLQRTIIPSTSMWKISQQAANGDVGLHVRITRHVEHQYLRVNSFLGRIISIKTLLKSEFRAGKGRLLLRQHFNPWQRKKCVLTKRGCLRAIGRAKRAPTDHKEAEPLGRDLDWIERKYRVAQAWKWDLCTDQRMHHQQDRNLSFGIGGI